MQNTIEILRDDITILFFETKFTLCDVPLDNYASNLNCLL